MEAINRLIFSSDAERAAAIPVLWRAAAVMAVAYALLFVVFPLGVGADYPNHLARAYIETAIDGSEALQRFYEIDYKFVPDFTIEMIVPRFAPLFGIYGAGSIVVAIAVMLAPMAGVLLSRTVNGSAGAWAPLIGFAALFNRNLEFGFINFLFGLGLALFCFCLWVRMAPGWKRSALIAPAAAFVAANHILGFLFLGYIVLLWEGAKYAFGERGPLNKFLPLLIMRDGAAFLPGLVMIAYAFVIAEDVSTYTGDMGMWSQRFVALTAGFGFFNAPLSVLAGTVALGVFLGGLYFGLRSGAITMHRDLAIVAAGVMLLVLIMPTHVAGIWGLHLRYGGAGLILAAAAIRFRRPARANIAAAVFAGVLVLLATNGAAQVMRIDRIQGEIRAGLATLPKGATIISATTPDVGFEIGVHAGSFAVIEADAYIPNLFTNISAVAVKPAMTALHMPQGKPHLIETLRDVRAKPLPPSENDRWSAYFHYQWPEHYTHLLLTRRSGESGADLKGLNAIASGPDFVLYEIDGALAD